MDRIAADLGLAGNNARKTIAALVERGHLKIEPGGGRNNTNRYSPVLKPHSEPKNPHQNVSVSGEETPTKTLGFKAENPHQNVMVSDHKSSRFHPENPHENVGGTLIRNPSPFGGTHAPTARAAGHASGNGKIKSTLYPKKARSLPSENGAPDAPTTAEAELFRRGKHVLGAKAGGLLAMLLKAKGGSVAKARAALELASEKDDPREFIGAIIRARDGDDHRSARERGDAW